jgi:hypothetical protein
VLWETIDTEIKRVEPFYQASRPQGSPAKHSIFAEHISLPPFLPPIQAFRWRQWTVFFCSISLVLIGTVSPVLQSQLFNTQTTLLQVGYFDPSYLGEFRAFTHLNSSAFPGDADAPVTGVVWGTDFWELGDLGINGQDGSGVTD